MLEKNEMVEIRALTAGDHDAWTPLWQGYQTFYKVNIAPEVSAVTWSRLLDESEPMGGALAWQGGLAVGMVHHIRHRSCWTIGDYMYLQDLFVSQETRGTGVGRQLIEYVYRVAQDLKCSRVHWLTHESNTEAMKLYERIAERSGFIQYRHIFK
jgi:GNAT superfamily N-acetyltransferase